MIDGVITAIDAQRKYAVAVSSDKKIRAIIHAATFEKSGVTFPKNIEPNVVLSEHRPILFEIGSPLATDIVTGVKTVIAGAVKELPSHT